jgi:hypothetical protein
MTPKPLDGEHARSFAPAARLLPRRFIARLWRPGAAAFRHIADEIGGQIGRNPFLNST